MCSAHAWRAPPARAQTPCLLYALRLGGPERPNAFSTLNGSSECGLRLSAL